MSKTLHIRKESLITIINEIFTNANVYSPLNFEHIRNIVIDNMSDSTLENVAELILARDPYELVYPGDIVKTIPPNYHEGTNFEIDVLKDMGLLSKEEMVYAKVISDSNWSTSAKYNPLYTQLKIEYIYHDQERQIKYEEATVSPFDLVKLFGKENKDVEKIIKDNLKNKKDAQAISNTDSISL